MVTTVIINIDSQKSFSNVSPLFNVDKVMLMLCILFFYFINKTSAYSVSINMQLISAVHGESYENGG